MLTLWCCATCSMRETSRSQVGLLHACFTIQLKCPGSFGFNVPLLVDTGVAAHCHNKPGPGIGCTNNVRKHLEHCRVNASAGKSTIRKINWGKLPRRGRRRNWARRDSRESGRNGNCSGAWCSNRTRWRASGCGRRQRCGGMCGQSRLSGCSWHIC